MQVKFFQEMSKIIALYDNLPTEINSLYGLETGHITISMSAVMSMRKFIGVLGDFHQLYPNITYNLIESGGKTTENLILNDEVDIGVTTLPVDHHKFECISLNKEELTVVLNKEHPLAQKSSIKMEELADENFIYLMKISISTIKLLKMRRMQDSCRTWPHKSHNGM